MHCNQLQHAKPSPSRKGKLKASLHSYREDYNFESAQCLLKLFSLKYLLVVPHLVAGAHLRALIWGKKKPFQLFFSVFSKG